MSERLVLAPELLLEGGRFREGREVRIDRRTGRVVAVGETGGAGGGWAAEGPAEGGRAADGSETDDLRRERLPRRALLPGFVNAHSHAFQRLLRGRTQWRPAAAPDADFWSWREAMYAVARRLAPDDLFAVARFCYTEMLRAGYTSVGEFHYLHRDPDGRPYDDPNELALRTLSAARAAGIRIVLLNACYAAGGFEEPLRPEQARFATPDLDGFVDAVDALAAATADDPLASVGVAPHSVRAVPRSWLRPLADAARERRLPIHMHLSEQPAEVAACRAAHGLGPVELAVEEGLSGPDFTGVHLTHPSGSEIRRFGESRATACLCPTTERDLGDGVPPVRELLEAGAGLAFGTDSQTLVDPFEEARLVEYHERLRALRRVVLGSSEPAAERPGAAGPGGRRRPGGAPEEGDPEGGRLDVAPRLLRAAAEGGARSLGLGAGAVRPGAAADLVAVDLDDLRLAGWTPTTLPDLLVFSGSAELVTDVWVGGVRRVEAGRVTGGPEAIEAFRAVAGRIG